MQIGILGRAKSWSINRRVRPTNGHSRRPIDEFEVRRVVMIYNRLFDKKHRSIGTKAGEDVLWPLKYEIPAQEAKYNEWCSGHIIPQLKHMKRCARG
jgi:hypothetical protein